MVWWTGWALSQIGEPDGSTTPPPVTDGAATGNGPPALPPSAPGTSWVLSGPGEDCVAACGADGRSCEVFTQPQGEQWLTAAMVTVGVSCVSVTSTTSTPGTPYFSFITDPAFAYDDAAPDAISSCTYGIGAEPQEVTARDI